MATLKTEGSNTAAVARRLASRTVFGRRVTPLISDYDYRVRQLRQIMADLRLMFEDPVGHFNYCDNISFTDAPRIEICLGRDVTFFIEIDEISGIYTLAKTTGLAGADFVFVASTPELVIDNVVAQIFFSGCQGGAVERSAAADALCSLSLVDSQRLICGRALRANRGDRQRTAQALGVTVGYLGNILAGNSIVDGPVGKRE